MVRRKASRQRGRGELGWILSPWFLGEGEGGLPEQANDIDDPVDGGDDEENGGVLACQNRIRY